MTEEIKYLNTVQAGRLLGLAPKTLARYRCTETQHTIVSGTTGSGKTVLISDLVSQIRTRGERCVIYDKMGSYTRSFFDNDRDVLMNPLDARAPRWSPFLEARNPRDFDMMAAALIPQQKDTVDPFWVTAARQLFSNGAGVLRQKGVKDNKVLVDHLLKTDLTALAEAKRDIDRDELGGVWQRQAADRGLDAGGLVAGAVERSAPPEREAVPDPASGAGRTPEPEAPGAPDIGDAGPTGTAVMAAPSREPALAGDRGRVPERESVAEATPDSPAAEAVAWAMAHLSEREAVFSRTDLLAGALAHAPGAVAIGDVEREVAALEKVGALHAVDLPGAEASLTTDRTVGEERETVALMRGGQARGRALMRGWQVQGHLNKGPLTAGQKDAVKLILSAKDRVVGVQGYAGTGKTTMLNRARALAEKKGWRMAGLAPSASAARTLASEAGIATETLQMFLARNAGVAEGRLTRKGAREMRAAFAKTILVVDEGSLASTVQARDLLRIAAELRMPRVVLVGDARQLDAVDAGKPFAQLQAAGMQTATMDEIMRQRDPALKEAVEASLKGDVGRAFEKLGENVAEVKPDNIAGAVAARWLRLDEEARANTGVMAPSHALRQAINDHIRERLAREGRIHGPAMKSERLVSMGYTNAEKALAANYGVGDVVAFHRPYKRIGVEKGDERRVMGVDHKAGAVRPSPWIAWSARQPGSSR